MPVDSQESEHLVVGIGRAASSRAVPGGRAAGSGRATEPVSSGSGCLQQRQAIARADVPLAAGRVVTIPMAGPGALAPPSL